MDKSDRHSKITGDFGEHFLLYFLSKLNYEAALIDYTGIDILAYDKTRNKKIGISVKARSRTLLRPTDGLLVHGGNYEKIISSCKYFDCEPWICIIIDKPQEQGSKIFLFLLSLDALCKYYPNFKTGKEFTFSMATTQLNKYNNDQNIFKIEFEYKASKWTNAY